MIDVLKKKLGTRSIWIFHFYIVKIENTITNSGVIPFIGYNFLGESSQNGDFNPL